ncbi:MAG: hypothetical protein GXY41_10805 [Phycisphaerae bacterium]|nr:hypothetical protein [Phycisphaerae bacterium]
MNFVAIDFETANSDPTSACAVGMAVVSNGTVVDKFYSLLRPLSNIFCSWNVRIHGIREEMVVDAPTFAEIYPEIQTRMGRGPLVAHNAVFDIRVLTQSLRQINKPVPDIEYFCTLQMCRALLPELPNHRLGTISRLLKIPIEHHDALSDAIACAQIAIELHRNTKPIIQMGKLNQYTKISSACLTHVSCNKTTLIENLAPDILDLLFSFNTPALLPTDSRFQGMRFVLTGEMDLLKREQAIEWIEYFGGRVTSAVSKQTDVVVVGCSEWDFYRKTGKAKTNKLKRAIELQHQGCNLQLLNQFDFFERIK